MSLNKKRLNIALSTIHNDEKGYFSTGQLVDLVSRIHCNVAMGAELHELYDYFQFLNQDICNVETIILMLAR